jgi:hypothetical protein
MLKFQFVRMERPAAVANASVAWQPMNGDSPPNRHETIWQHQWHWLRGTNIAPNGQAAKGIGTLVDQLGRTGRQARLQAADELGLHGQKGRRQPSASSGRMRSGFTAYHPVGRLPALCVTAR